MERRRKLIIIGVVLLVISLLASISLSACAPSIPTPTPSPAPAGKEPIKIGIILGLTGYMGELEIYSKMGADLYAEMMKPEVAGRPVQFIIEDDGTDPAKCMDKMRKLIDSDKVCLTIGPTDSAAKTGAMGYADRMKVPNLAISCDSAPIPRDFKWAWCPRGIDTALTYALGSFVYDVDGARTAVGMFPDFVSGHDTAEGFTRGFESRGGKVVQVQYFSADTMDFAPYLAKLQKADALVAMFTGGGGVPAPVQIEAFGIKTPKYVYFSALEAPKVQQDLDVGYGWTVMTPWSYAVDIPGSPEFVQAFKQRYGELPLELAADVWSSIQVALDALNRTGGDTSPDALAKALDETDLQTITGRVKFGLDHIGLNRFYAVRFAKVAGVWEHQIVGIYEVKVTGRAGETYALESTRVK